MKPVNIFVLGLFLLGSVGFSLEYEDVSIENRMVEHRPDTLYLDFFQLYFSKEGVFFETELGERFPIENLRFNHQGYQTTTSSLGREIQEYRCSSCGSIYSYNPSKCPICGGGSIYPIIKF